MARVTRLIIALVAGFVPSACNQLVSTDPWFSTADAVGVPTIRDGLWVVRKDGQCDFDERVAVEQWPECADALLVRDGEWRTVARNDDPANDGEPDPPPRLENHPVLIANGDPLVGQIWWAGSQPSDQFGDLVEAEVRDAYYTYLALRPLSFDPAGKVNSYRAWTVICGPLPLVSTPDDGAEHSEIEQSYVTQTPFPGLTVQGDNCVADTQASVHRAARLSEPLQQSEATEARWVRDAME